MTERLIDRDPITGVESWWRYTPHDDSATIIHKQDVSALLDRNKEAAADPWKTQRGIKKDWWKYASVPDILWIKWRQDKGVDILNPHHKKELFKLLNSPEYKYLRTTSKRHE